MSEIIKRAQGIADRIIEAIYWGGDTARSALGFVAKRRELAARGVDVADHKRASGHVEKGRRFYNNKQYVRAIECFERALDYDQGYGLAHYYLGNARYKHGDIEGAVKAWKRTAEVAPESDLSSKAMRRIISVKGKFRRVIDRMEQPRQS